MLEAARWGFGALYRGFIRAVGKVAGRRGALDDFIDDKDLPEVSEEQFNRISSLMGGACMGGHVYVCGNIVGPHACMLAMNSLETHNGQP